MGAAPALQSWDDAYWVRANWLEIPKAHIQNTQRFKEALTFSNGAYFAAVRMGYESNLPSHYMLYEETDDTFRVPRNFREVVADTRWAGVPLDAVRLRDATPGKQRTYRAWRHRLTPRARQVPAIAYLKEPGDKILCLACGAGKTCVTLAALCELAPERLPALIVVHTQELMDQWIARIRQHVLMGPVRVGKVQGPACDYRLPFTVAMLQTLARKTYPAEFYNSFGTVVFDEAHRCGAPLFSRVAHQFPCERWGLSATPDRADGADVIFKAHLGPVGYVDLEQDLVARTFFVEMPTSYDMRKFRLYGSRNVTNVAKLLTHMGADQDRNALIQSYVTRLAKQGRTILVLGERVEQLETLAATCGFDAAPLAGPLKKEERQAALQAQVVFATAKRAKEGLDRDQFDTLMFVTPVTDTASLQQSYGRILRMREDKLEPFVIVFEDLDVPPMHKKCNKVRSWLQHNKLKYQRVGIGQ